MVIPMNRNRVVLVSTLTAAALGVAGLAALALPAGAGTQPTLPDVSADDLVASVLSVEPPAMAGKIGIDNALGLPAIPGLPTEIGNGNSEFRVWYDGDGRSRVSLPSENGERTMVDDGTTVWTWDSDARTVTKVTPDRDAKTDPRADAGERFSDPATAARELLSVIQPTSVVSVDGTAMVADRPAYELVVAPAPTERTLLREVRIAIDSQTRLPLRLEVLANGTDDPVLSVGFDSIDVSPQDPSLFRFTPPEGATVTEPDDSHATRPDHDELDAGGLFGGESPTVVGEGWDTVVVATLPDELMGSDDEKSDSPGPFGHRAGGLDPQALLDRIGTAVDGPWGSGRLISTAVVSVIITKDGRVAAGAVPQQVLVEALSR